MSAVASKKRPATQRPATATAAAVSTAASGSKRRRPTTAAATAGVAAAGEADPALVVATGQTAALSDEDDVPLAARLGGVGGGAAAADERGEDEGAAFPAPAQADSCCAAVAAPALVSAAVCKPQASAGVAAVVTGPVSAAAVAVQGEADAAAAADGDDFVPLDRLAADGGVPLADVAKLRTAGVHTVGGLLMRCRRDLVEVKGLSEAKVDKALEAARRIAGVAFVTGTQCLAARRRIVRLTTGSSALDALLGGGVESAAITEAFGEFRTGKTQLAHTMCVTAQLPLAMGGGNGRAVYIDTEGTFRPERVAAVAERFGLEPAAVLDNILVARAFTHEQQATLVAAVAAQMAVDPFALLVVDSVTALFRVDFTGRGELAERQQRLGRVLAQLMKLAEEFNVAVFVTNQVVADPGGGSVFVVDPKKPVGGHILAHACTTRLSLRKGRGEQRIAKLYDSPSMPEAEAVFAIAVSGIVDATD